MQDVAIRPQALLPRPADHPHQPLVHPVALDASQVFREVWTDVVRQEVSQAPPHTVPGLVTERASRRRVHRKQMAVQVMDADEPLTALHERAVALLAFAQPPLRFLVARDVPAGEGAGLLQGGDALPELGDLCEQLLLGLRGILHISILGSTATAFARVRPEPAAWHDTRSRRSRG